MMMYVRRNLKKILYFIETPVIPFFFFGFIKLMGIGCPPPPPTLNICDLYMTWNQKVDGSIPGGVSGFFVDINTFDRTTTLGSTRPLTEMSISSISWGVKAAGS
jgi:hypothetical protein